MTIVPRPTWGDADFAPVDWVLEGVADVAMLEQRIEELTALVPGLSPCRLVGWSGQWTWKAAEGLNKRFNDREIAEQLRAGRCRAILTALLAESRLMM
ncbi:hypothetical protein [Streptomyces nigra]|uniref:hypothetical protein n=1 Tax=Streptomyces nigra TaxID=1827580 RepID=UPI00381A47C0